MYYQNYEDYMRSVLGYPMESANTYETYNYSEPYEMTQEYLEPRYDKEIIDLYPDIYKIVNPMVCKICDANTKPLSRELIDKMTDEIYLNLENQPDLDTVINVRVNTTTANDKNSKTTNNVRKSSESIENKESENREDRQTRPNNTLKDLIRILILNRLLGRIFPRRPNRPRPPRPIRPPMRSQYERNYNYDEYFRF